MQCISVDRSILGFERILKQITHLGISIMLKFQRECDRPELYCIYRNLDNIYSF